MILKVESGIRGKICHDIHRYVKANKKYMQIYGKNKKLYLSIWMQIIYTDGQCHKSCLQMVLSGLKIHLNLIKTYRKL